MKTKEELKNTYIKYSSDITEEIFDKIIDKLENLGFKKYGIACDYLGFKNYGYISFNKNSNIQTSTYVNNDEKEIQISDILENNQFEAGKWYKGLGSNRDYYGICAGEIIEDKFPCKIYISPGGKYNTCGDYFYNFNRATLLTDLSEIQQYLPDNHPDKLVKPIEKWSVGSYVVFINSYGDSNKGDIDKIKNILDSGRIWCEKEGITTKDSKYTRWFTTLSEAEAFSKSLLEPEEPKTLTINDLVEGEIYYWKSKKVNETWDWWVRKCSNSGTNNSNLKISQDYFDATPGTLDSNSYIISKATVEQIKHLKVCKKQSKFIPQDQLDMYDSEGNLIKNKLNFKIGDYVITNRYSSLYNGRILRITKFSDRYPDIAYFEVFDDGYYSKNDNFSLDKVERFATPEEIAKITKPEPKVNRNVYYEVSNQEEYEEILNWLESNGEKVDKGFCVNNIWNFVYYHKDSKDWYLDNVKPDLPKAEFPFKSKQSIKVDTYFEEAGSFPSFKGSIVDLSCFNTFISGQFICPTIEETPTNEKVKVQLINVPRI